MSYLLLMRTLNDLRKRFASIQTKGRLRIILSETPILVRSPGLQPSEFFVLHDRGSNPVWKWSVIYRSPMPRMDAAGNNVVTQTPFLRADGEPALNEDGQQIEYADCGACRLVQLEGQTRVWSKLKVLVRDAGHLLDGLTTAVRSAPSRFQHETLGLADPVPRWFCALFDLAWERIPGSPLRPEIDKSVKVEIDPDIVSPETPVGDLPADTFKPSDSGEETPDAPELEAVENDESSPKHRRMQDHLKPRPWCKTVPLADWSQFIKDYRWPGALRGVSDPPEWFSTLADVRQASLYAIDILSHDIEVLAARKGPRGRAHGKRRSDRQKRPGTAIARGASPYRKAEETKVGVIAALMMHHKFDDREENLNAATQQELMKLTGWTQPKVSRAMKALFGPKGMNAYKRRCSAGTIMGFLKRHDDGSHSIEAIDNAARDDID